MEATTSRDTTDLTPTGSQTQVITSDRLPAQVKRKKICKIIQLKIESNGY